MFNDKRFVVSWGSSVLFTFSPCCRVISRLVSQSSLFPTKRSSASSEAYWMKQKELHLFLHIMNGRGYKVFSSLFFCMMASTYCAFICCHVSLILFFHLIVKEDPGWKYLCVATTREPTPCTRTRRCPAFQSWIQILLTRKP